MLKVESFGNKISSIIECLNVLFDRRLLLCNNRGNDSKSSSLDGL